MARDQLGEGGAAGAQVITVGVHHGGPVPGRADHPLWFGGAGVALDRPQHARVREAAAQHAAERAQGYGFEHGAVFRRLIARR